MKRCRDYVGVACVDGSCPKANAEEYEESGMDVISNCNDCFYYKGCEDCAFLDTEYCTGKDMIKKQSGKVIDFVKGGEADEQDITDSL